MESSQMWKVAICDKDCEICSYIENIMLEYQKREWLPFIIEVFQSGVEFVNAMKEGAFFDLIFLDVRMRGIDGIKIGHMIREVMENEDSKIVYMSEEKEYAMDLFAVRPFQFLLKPLKKEEILQVTQNAVRLMKKDDNYFYYKKKRELKKIHVKNILYFEKIGKKINIIFSDDTTDWFYGTLKQIYKELEKFQFFYCHQSFLVSYHHVKMFKYEYLIMKNGEEIPISQPKRKKVREMQIKMEASIDRE